mmetsp:Transcript_34957/g.72800  ORF Transcript_34957/g.72800 Transcript_34957/m.72800 type:complete len:209 (+) Transcript_34957:192-818(+)
MVGFSFCCQVFVGCCHSPVPTASVALASVSRCCLRCSTVLVAAPTFCAGNCNTKVVILSLLPIRRHTSQTSSQINPTSASPVANKSLVSSQAASLDWTSQMPSQAMRQKASLTALRLCKIISGIGDTFCSEGWETNCVRVDWGGASSLVLLLPLLDFVGLAPCKTISICLNRKSPRPRLTAKSPSTRPPATNPPAARMRRSSASSSGL